ncbi:exocyst complex component EXO84C-like isoform X2 [Momordica charantia]|nr:exocyst complex component EXO84C-like isoform X2 [Momordica charantia]
MQPPSTSSPAHFHDSDDESEVRSMTAKGINHLCSELLELKAESNGDFHRIIISTCLSFSRTFEQVKVMQQDLIQLKGEISTQTNLVKHLVDGIDLAVEAGETDPTVVDSTTLQPSQFSRISWLIDSEAHIYSVAKALDALICEDRIDEALEIIKVEDDNLQRVKAEEEDYPFDIVTLYDCVVSDKRAKIKLRLAHASDYAQTAAQGEIVPTTDRPPPSHDVPVEF